MLCTLLFAAIASAELLRLEFANVVSENPIRRRGELGLPIANDIFHQRYLINMTVGTPPQKVSITVDTGSADILLPIYNSSGCAPSCPPGAFVPQNSSTLRTTDHTYNGSFGTTPGNVVLGKYYQDTATIGSAVLPNTTGNKLILIAVVDLPDYIYDAGIYGLLGLGSRYGEATFVTPSSPYFQDKNGTFPTIYDLLKNQGYINRRLFSLWLNDQSATTGTILFGGVDPTKYHGELLAIPVLTSGPDRLFTGWTINTTSVTYVNGTSGEKEPLPGTSDGIITVVDSGSPNMYLPTVLADFVADQLNATTVQTFPYVACALRHAHDRFLEFGFGEGRPKISVPYPEIIYPYGAPANVGKVKGDDGTPLCYLGLIATPSNIVLLGDTFIRSTYMVFDVDNLTISMAPVAHKHHYG